MVLTALATATLCGLAWSFEAHVLGRGHADESNRLLLALGAAELERTLEGARLELERIALDEGLRRACAAMARVATPGKAERRAVEKALRRLLVSSERLDAAVVIDLRGAQTPIGSGRALRDLAAALEPRSALDNDLGSAMRGADLGRVLSQVEAASLRTVDLEDGPPLVLASVPVEAAGRRVATLHGHVGAELLAEALGRTGDLLGTRLSLLDAEGRPLAASDGGDATPSHLGLLARAWSQRRALPLELLGGKIVVDESGIRSLTPIVRALGGSIALAIAAAAVFGGLALARATRIARPLWALNDALKQAGEGEEVDIPVLRTRGEVEALCHNLSTALRRLSQRRNELERENRALLDQNDNFQTQHKNLAKLTVTDALTDLPNRRFFEDQLGKEIKRLSRSSEGLAMLVIDIDDFKKLNDQFGHSAGDEFLRQVARILKETARATDLVARIGGEEFVIVATGTRIDGAEVFAEKVRTAVAEASFIVDASMRPRRATISVGVAAYRGSQTDLFNSADAALYEAKAAGKNCVVVAKADATSGR